MGLWISTSLYWDHLNAGDLVSMHAAKKTSYTKGAALLDLLHFDHDGEVMGKRHLENPINLEDAYVKLHPDGAQYVTLTEDKGGVLFLLHSKIVPPLASLDEAVGYKFPWHVYYVQVRLRGEEAASYESRQSFRRLLDMMLGKMVLRWKLKLKRSSEFGVQCSSMSRMREVLENTHLVFSRP